MNAPDSIEFDSWLEEKAAEWLTERDEGFGPGRAEAFAGWCAENPRHAEAVARVKQTLSLLDDPSVHRKIERRFGPSDSEPKLVKRPLWKSAVPWAAGLVAAFVLGVVGWRSFAPQRTIETHASTEAGPQRTALSDGSVIDLNASSNVQVEFSRKERRVTLTAGEGYFQVAHDTRRPFIVTANGVAVRAVGTAFNVRLAGDKVDILVTEGRVEVDQASASSGPAKPLVPALAIGERTQIAPGVGAVPRIEQVVPEAVRYLLSWQDRMSCFIDVPLREMIARLNRCNATKLALEDPTLGDRKIGGVIDLSQVNAFVRMLERNGEIVAERRSDREIVLRRAR